MAMGKDSDISEKAAATAASEPSSSTASTAASEKDAVLRSAPPPWHTMALIVLLLAVFIARIPTSLSTMTNLATPQTFLHVNFPRLLTARHVGYARLLFGCVMLSDSLYAVLYGHWEQDTDYYTPYSRLKVVRNMPFRGCLYSDGNLTTGLMTLSSFTMWSWVLEGITFCTLGGTTLYLVQQDESNEPPEPLPAWLYRAALMGWEIAAPTSLLVSAVVKYVLWPMALEESNGDNNNANLFKHPLALLEHNFNVLSCLVEVALLGGLPIRYQDFCLAPLFGLVYVLYSYAMMHAWAAPEHGPQFIYPFLDTTLEWRTTACLIALLAVLTLAFGIFAALDHLITETLQEGDLLSHAAAVLVVGAGVCKFWD